MKKNMFLDQIEKDIKKATKQVKENPFGATAVGVDNKDLGNGIFPSLLKAERFVQKQAKTQRDFVWGMVCTLDKPATSDSILTVKNGRFFSKKTGWTEDFSKIDGK